MIFLFAVIFSLLLRCICIFRLVLVFFRLPVSNEFEVVLFCYLLLRLPIVIMLLIR